MVDNSQRPLPRMAHFQHKITELIKKHFDMRPKAIIDNLNLLRPIYRKTAVYGHFGRDDPDFTWEETDKVEILQKAAH